MSLSDGLSSIRTMLYQLVAQNPYKDITLHVSASNPAMVRISAWEKMLT
jgi:aryl carrier-like protein